MHHREASQLHCPHCDGQDCIQIEIHLQTDDTVQFYSCRRCETKWWEREGEGEISLDEVLNLASQKSK
jgi:DNA-directed RNA polymerase subunit M/transcription elongation factor TFIIS